MGLTNIRERREEGEMETTGPGTTLRKEKKSSDRGREGAGDNTNSAGKGEREVQRRYLIIGRIRGREECGGKRGIQC